MTNIRNALMQAAGTAASGSTYVEDVFSTHLYTGNNTAGNAINNGLDLSGEGGMVWIKARNATDNACIFDTERGVTKFISSGNNNAESTDANSLTSFNNNGFTLGTGWTIASVNYTYNYASWAFRKQEGFFDVVKFSTTGGGGTQTVSHNLGSIPGVIILKRRTSGGDQNWYVFHKSVTSPSSDWWINYGMLNSTASFANWGSTTGITSAPTSSAITLSTYYTNTTADYVAYFFAEGGSDDQIFGDDGDEAIIKTGSFSHTSGTPTFVNCGFEAAWVIAKRYDSTDSWWMADNMRGFTPNGIGIYTPYLAANLGAAEGTSDWIGPNAQGFDFNYLTGDYVYIAIRRGPMKEPSAGTDVFKAISRTGGGGSASITGVGFSPDLYLSKATNQGSYNPLLYNRLRGKRYLLTSATDAQPNSDGGLDSYDMDGVSVSGGSSFGLDGSGDSIINYFFKRYPKVFDVVVYTGNGSARTINHNLGVTPEMIIKKRIDSSSFGDWIVWVNAGLSDADYIKLNSSNMFAYGEVIDSSENTASVFGLTDAADGNLNGSTNVAYLFASLDGISKVGTYTGTGNDLNVTGLGASARFVLIKRTDASGDWYVYDSTSGIVSGNDPYFFINSTAVSVTNTDYIDPHSSGFTITSSAPAALNASGGTYIYLAFS